MFLTRPPKNQRIVLLPWLPALFVGILLLPPSSCSGQPTPSGKERLVLLDGRTTEGKIVDIDTAGKVAFQGLNNRIELSRLHHIIRPTTGKTSKTTASIVVDLLGGGRLLAEKISIVTSQCRIQRHDGKNLTISIDAIRAVRFTTEKPDKVFQQALANPGEDFDQLLVKIDGKVEVVQGFIETINKDQVVFQLQEDTRSLARENLYGIVVAYVGSSKKEKMPCRVELIDGSVIEGRLTSLSQGKLNIGLGLDTTISVAWSKVAKITNRSDRLLYLSDMEPREAIQQPIVTLPRNWQRDKNISGGPLALGETLFSKGIGTNAYSRLTFDTAGKYDMFVATIGIDRETQGRGDCLFLVQGDGQELFRQRVQGSDAPRVIRVEVKGTQEVSLIVQPGKDLDLGDHANWCQARFLRLAN